MPALKEKILTLSEAAGLIPDGARIHIGGFSVHNHPMAFVHELIRKGVKDLTLVGHVGTCEIDILVGAGSVKKVEISYVGLEEHGLAQNYRRAVEKGLIELEEYSEPVSFERFACSSRGQSFFTTQEMLGTDLPKYNPKIKEMISPYNGQKYHLVPAADPDWVVLHAPMGDKYGNVLFFERRQLPERLDETAGQSCANVIVTVEQIISRDRVMGLSHLNVLPRFRTTAIVEAPYGAHPTSCIKLYDQDREHLGMYARMSRRPEGLKEYLDKYVYGVKSHLEYLNLVGLESLLKCRVVGGTLV
ncbi:MAG: CoA transferase subunit A [Deltaproteobacteria bacterium]|nr:CoA transferase subunit A [Deltaproteobacteria bacterium]